MASNQDLAAKKIQRLWLSYRRAKEDNEFAQVIASFVTVISLNALSLILCVL